VDNLRHCHLLLRRVITGFIVRAMLRSVPFPLNQTAGHSPIGWGIYLGLPSLSILMPVSQVMTPSS